MRQTEQVIGVVSDTHGVLRPEAVDALKGVARIVHAGDVGDAAILKALSAIAPVHGVRGNVDVGPGVSALPATEVVQVGDCALYVVHDIGTLNLDPAAAGFRAVIFGHSHRPEATVRNGVHYLNPGSIGPRRFSLPVSLMRLRICGTDLDVEMVELDV